MFKSLMTDMIAIDADPIAVIDYAHRYGFQGVDLRLDTHEASLRTMGADAFKSALNDAGLRPGYCSILPGKISCDEASWREGLTRVPALAELAQQLGYARTTTVVLPFDDEKPFDEYFQLHLDRIGQAAPVLADHGISLGLEYVSPVTRRAGHKHPFIYDLKGLRALYRASGHANVGVLLDTFHWHCAHESAKDIESLDASEVVAVHVNDLIADRPVDQQMVMERALPCETGMIDMADFIGALEKIGYDGPLTSEPTNPKWKSIEPEQAVRELGESMSQMMALAAV